MGIENIRGLGIDISDPQHVQLANPLDGPGRRVSGVEPSQDLSASNCSVKPWKNGRSASSPQRSSHIASVSPLSHQRSGWTTPRTGQPRVLASRETPLHGWRTDHIVPTPWVSSPLSAPSPDGGGRGTLRRLLGRHRGQTRRRSSPRLDRTVTSASNRSVKPWSPSAVRGRRSEQNRRIACDCRHLQPRPGPSHHGLTEQLRPPTSRMVQWIPIQLEGYNEGMEAG